jgi:SAM-dependent methyltransferase
MHGYDIQTYGDAWAEIYDGMPIWPDPTSAVDFLAGQAGDGPVLELGIGTGRIAIPLAERGFEVHGIDSSPAMLAKLAGKDAAAGIRVTKGDFADVDVDGVYGLVYSVGCSFLQLGTAEAQLRCLKQVRNHLGSDGTFVVEALNPDLGRFRTHQDVMVSHLSVDEVVLFVSIHDPVGQTVSSQRIVLRDGGYRLYPNRIRYVWPTELDMMAEAAGLRLIGRWANWDRVRFTGRVGAWVAAYAKG